MENKFQESVLGVPQGGPLSPLLSNIMLHELDKELARRGHRFVRYAVSTSLKAYFIHKCATLNLLIQYLEHESTRTDVHIG